MDVGVDLVDIKRITKLIRNKKFINRVFSDEEIKYCSGRKNSAQHYAVRFAAKEAVWKLIGKKGIKHKDISVINTNEGKPNIVLSRKLKKLESKISVSLSHSKDYAIAVAIFDSSRK